MRTKGEGGVWNPKNFVDILNGWPRIEIEKDWCSQNSWLPFQRLPAYSECLGKSNNHFLFLINTWCCYLLTWAKCELLQPGPKDGNYLARRSTGFLKGDNAPLRQDVAWRRDNIFCPEGMVVITTFYLGIWALSRGGTMTVLFLCWLKMLGIRPCKKLVFSRARAFGLKGSRAEPSRAHEPSHSMISSIHVRK